MIFSIPIPAMRCVCLTLQSVSHPLHKFIDVSSNLCFFVGLTAEGDAHIMSSERRCFSCHGVFSTEGYDTHRVHGACTNTPKLEKSMSSQIVWLLTFNFDFTVTGWALPLRSHVEFKDRNYPAGTKPPVPIEFSDTAIGIAWSEWNSRIGVPEDVWVLLHTSMESCSHCGLVRTFEADIAHRSANNVCLDPSQHVGQGVSFIDNGVGGRYTPKGFTYKEDRVVLYSGPK